MSEIPDRRRADEIDPHIDDEEAEPLPENPRDERAQARAQAAEYLY